MKNNIKPMTLADRVALSFEDSYPKDWPPIEYYIHESQITQEMVDGLKQLIDSGSPETAIDKFISANPALLTAVLDFNNTGHHAAWVIPKKNIRPKVSKDIPGLIPDFLVGGKNSFGITWYVVELKGAEHKLFVSSAKKLYLSSVANMGLCQLLEYMHFCNKSQSILRDTLKIKGFSYAEGFLFIGRSDETKDERAKDLKAAINKMNKNIQIRSYDALFEICNKLAVINANRG